MKTEMTLTRNINGIEFVQNPKTEMILISGFIANFNKVRGLSSNGSGQLLSVIETTRDLNFDDYMHMDTAKSFMRALASSEGCLVTDLVAFNKVTQSKIWVHPLIFIDFCMEVSVTFKVAAWINRTS